MTQCRRTKWILGNVQNNYRNMTDYVNRQVHAVGPATEKARRPKVRRWRGTERRWRLAERRRCRQTVSDNDMQSPFKYWGAFSCIHWRTVMQSLNSTRSKPECRGLSHCPIYRLSRCPSRANIDSPTGRAGECTPVSTWTCPHGEQVHYTHAHAEESHDCRQSLAF